MQDERTCVAHGAASRCSLCGRPRPPGPGWYEPFRRRPRCPTCSVGAVDTQEQARRHIPGVRADMAALGVSLDRRVRVTLVDTMPTIDGASPTGLTHSFKETGEVIGIEVLSGLTAVHFGQTVAHEIGHAWLIERGAAVTHPVLVEGLCEVFASAWLKKQPGALPPRLREAMATNPDKTYGAGYRVVREAVVRNGIRKVLHALCVTGRLP